MNQTKAVVEFGQLFFKRPGENSQIIMVNPNFKKHNSYYMTFDRFK